MVGNRIRNGGFENWRSGLPIHWTGSGSVTQDTQTPHQGISAVLLSASTLPAGVSQSVLLPFVLFSLPRLQVAFSLAGPVNASVGQRFSLTGEWLDPRSGRIGTAIAIDVFANGSGYTYFRDFTTVAPPFAAALALTFTATGTFSAPLALRLDDVALW